MTVQLYAKHSGEGPAVLLMHGLFGAGNNLGALARSLQQGYEVHSLDLPNHGRSDWLTAPDLPAMADGVQRWMEQQGVVTARLVGHSLGGKVAMQLALQYPGQVDALVVADIAPVRYGAHHDSVFSALDAVDAARCASRAEAAALLADHLEDEGVIQFLLMSLQRDAHGVFRWRFDLHGIKAAYAQLLAPPSSDLVYDGPVLFIKGGESDYIRDAHWPDISARFPGASLEVMAGCGHWLHIQEPQRFNGIVERFLSAYPQA